MIEQSRQDAFPSNDHLPPVALRPHVLDRQHNLPAELTGLVGRVDAINELRRLLVNARLLTLTGAGGIGKTRLALALGRTVLPDYPDGVWLVELASLGDPALVAPAVATVLGIPETDRPALEHLVEVLRPKAMLVVLDNCEHLVGSCAGLAAGLLRACPELQILATSREALGVVGEVIWRVPGLPVPAPLGSAPDASQQAEQAAAVQLFVERASAASGFHLTQQNSAAVAAVCRQLEGIPLAIELAAGRTRMLTPAEIAGRLRDPLRVLIGASHTASQRQHTLRATLDWSFELLSEAERTLFRRLSVFAGGCTFEALTEVCATGAGRIEAADMLDLLGRLVDQSLVVPEPTDSGSMRYRLLEPLRQYAHERLLELGTDDTVRARHLNWCIALAEEASPALIGPHQRAWFSRLEREHDNLRAALEYSLQNPQDAAPALRLAGALYWFWWRRGHLAEGRNWLARTLDLDARLGTCPEPATQQARLRALRGAGVLACSQGDYRAAERLLAASLALAQELNDIRSTADALYWVAYNGFWLGEREGGRDLLQQSLTLWRQVGDPWGTALPLGPQARAAAWRGDYERAITLAQERLRMARESEDPWLIANAYVQLGVFAYEQGQHDVASDWLQSARHAFAALDDHVGLASTLIPAGRAARARGDLSEALSCFGEGLLTHQTLGQHWGIEDCLENVASLLIALGRAESAARLTGSAEALRQRLGLQPPTRDIARYKSDIQTARAALGAHRFDALMDAGQALPIADAVAEALAIIRASIATLEIAKPGGTRKDQLLTPRELEVATLIARGRSNRDIAEELVIAVSTAERHVANILRKLELASRTQVANWVHQELAQRRLS